MAGNGSYGSSGDGGLATEAQLGDPFGVATDQAGNVYIAEWQGHRVRKVSSSGIISTLAGTGVDGFSGDGGPATSAQLFFPSDVAVDGTGNVYIADSGNNRIRKVDASGTISTVAGSGDTGHFQGGFSGDGGPATSAELSIPGALTFDSIGVMYIADSWNHRVRRVDTTGTITTVAGSTARGFSGDGGPATSAQFDHVGDVAVGPAESLYVVDTFNQRVRKVDSSGTITTVAGGGGAGFSGDGGPATSAGFGTQIYGVEVDPWGNFFLSVDRRIRRVDASGTITTVAGTGIPTHPSEAPPSGNATSVSVADPKHLDLDASGNLFIADSDNFRVWRMQTSLLFMSDSPDPLKAGQAFTYRVTVGGLATNATGVRLVDTLPPEVAFRYLSTTQGRCSQSAGTVTCDLGSIPRGRTATVNIRVTAQKAGFVANTATVSANEAGAIPGPKSATAETRISAYDCGRVITQSTVLTKDIGPCGETAVVVGADNVTLDLGGKRIFGFPGPSNGHAAGVRLPMKNRVTVKNGTISGFDGGVVLGGGGGHTLTNLTVRDNVGPDDPLNQELELSDGIVLFHSRNNTINKNRVLHNGVFDGIGVLGFGADGNSIQDNVVEDTVGAGDGGAAGQGIIVNAASLGEQIGDSIQDTRIVGNLVRGNGSSGISNVSSINGGIVGNRIEGNGRTNFPRNGIGIQVGAQSPVATTNLLVQRNQIHGNGGNGIDIPEPPFVTSRTATGNRILDNNAADNALDASQFSLFWDLHDANPNCAGNVWARNVWGSGGYNPECTATAGSGPSQPSAASADTTIARPPPAAMPVLRRLPPATS